jgi:hypothetical protein
MSYNKIIGDGHKKALMLIERARKAVKKSDTYKEICKEYGVDLDFIDSVTMCFADLETSARTDAGVIYFNERLRNSVEDLEHYMIHEFIHVLQQCLGDGPTLSSNKDNYLDDENEQESFQGQSEYIEETEGDSEADKYIDKVLDHHGVSGDERKEKEKELRGERLSFFFKRIKKDARMINVSDDFINEVFIWAQQVYAGRICARIKQRLEGKKFIKTLVKDGIFNLHNTISNDVIPKMMPGDVFNEDVWGDFIPTEMTFSIYIKAEEENGDTILKMLYQDPSNVVSNSGTKAEISKFYSNDVTKRIYDKLYQIHTFSEKQYAVEEGILNLYEECFAISRGQIVNQDRVCKNFETIKLNPKLTEIPEGWEEGLDFCLTFSDKRSVKTDNPILGEYSGYFDYYGAEVIIHKSYNVETISELYEELKSLRKTIYHEGIHALQFLNRDVVGMDRLWGLPKKFKIEDETGFDEYGNPVVMGWNHDEDVYKSLFDCGTERCKKINEIFETNISSFREEWKKLSRLSPPPDIFNEFVKFWVALPNDFMSKINNYDTQIKRDLIKNKNKNTFYKLKYRNMEVWKCFVNKFFYNSKVALPHTLRDIELYSNLYDIVEDFKERYDNLLKVYGEDENNVLKTEMAKAYLGEPNKFPITYAKRTLMDPDNAEKWVKDIYDNGIFKYLREADETKWKKAAKEFLEATNILT